MFDWSDGDLWVGRGWGTGGGSGMGGHPALRSLVVACGAEHARVAGPTDHVAGAPARWVVTPADAGQVGRVLGIAARYELSVAVCGSGTKLDWGRPPSAVDVLVDTGRLVSVARGSLDSGSLDSPLPDSGPLHPGDGPAPGPTATIGAGASLRAVRAALATTGRRLPLDVGSPAATVGGAVSADEAGPLRFSHGGARELVAGLEFVTADGVIHHCGVPAGARSDRRRPAGDPLAEVAPLLIGACGTLGVVTRVTMRVFQLPADRAWVVRRVRTPWEAHELTRALLAAPLTPSAIELDLPTGAGELAVLVEGAPGEVAAGVRALRALLGRAVAQGGPPDWWGRYPFSQYQTALRVTAPAADLAAAVGALRDAAGGGVPVRGSAGTGVMYAALPGGATAEQVHDALAAVRATLGAKSGGCSLLRAPWPVRAALDPLDEQRGGGTIAPLAKAWLDPARRFVPGRLPCLC